MKSLARLLPLALFVIVLVGLIGSSLVPGAQAQNLAQSTCTAQYTIQRGEWLASIARKCGLTLQAVLDANTNLANPNLVFPGQVISLPMATGTSTANLSGTQTTQSSFGTGQTGTPPAFQQGTPGTTATDLSGLRTYAIRPGDSLIDLAARFDVTLEELVQANPDLLQAGGLIRLPANAEIPAATPSPAATLGSVTPSATGNVQGAPQASVTPTAGGQISEQPTESGGVPNLPADQTEQPSFGDMEP